MMLKNNEERTSFLRNEKNWEVEYLTPDIKMLTLKLTPKLYVRKIQVMGFNKYFKKSGWYTQFTKFFYPDDLYYSPNTSDTELLRYLTAHKNDDYIEDLEKPKMIKDPFLAKNTMGRWTKKEWVK